MCVVWTEQGIDGRDGGEADDGDDLCIARRLAIDDETLCDDTSLQ